MGPPETMKVARWLEPIYRRMHRQLLAGFRGILQSDAYGAYGRTKP